MSKLAANDPLTFFSRLANRLHTSWLTLTYPFPSIGKDVWVHRSVELYRAAAKYISIGNRVSIDRDSWINIAVIPENDDPLIVIEDGCRIGRNCVISAKNCIHIERDSIFAPGAFIADHNHGFEDVTIPIGLQGTTAGGTVRIEQGSWVGYSAAIVSTSGELVIGRNSIVGTNSVLTRSLPPYSIAVGNPARVVKHFDMESQKWILGTGAGA